MEQSEKSSIICMMRICTAEKEMTMVVPQENGHQPTLRPSYRTLYPTKDPGSTMFIAAINNSQTLEI